ncbi:MAG: AAA family ATPase [Phycisphaerales bacterium]|nr:AAA family ATPase [Phycisphaerales bacterium]
METRHASELSLAHDRPGHHSADDVVSQPTRDRTLNGSASSEQAHKPGDDALARMNGHEAASRRVLAQPMHRASKSAASATGSEPAMRIAARLRAAIGQERYTASFEKKVILRLDEGTLEVAVPNKVLCGLLERRFGALIDDLAAEEIGRRPIRFVVAPDLFGPRAEAAAEHLTAPAPATIEAKPMSVANVPSRKPSPSSTPSERYRLETFIVGESNRLAYNAAAAMADAGPESAGYSPLFIHGPCGVGKTHLLSGIAQRFKERHPGASVRVTGGEAFVNEYVAAVRAGDVEKFRRACRRVDLLCIDDVHFLTNKQSTQGELLHTLDELQRTGARIVLVSDEHPRHIKQFSAALVSRFMSGMVAGIGAPDPELREKCVRMFAKLRGLSIDDSGIALLVERTGQLPGQDPTSIRDIEGLITRVDALHRLVPEYRVGGENGSAGAVGALVVERALGGPGGSTVTDPGASQRPSRPVRIEAIIGHTAAAMGIEVSELSGKTRHPRVVLARAIITHIARQMTTLSYPEIARAIGRPNHSTVITAFQRFAKQLEADEAVDAPGAPEARTLTVLVRQIGQAAQAAVRR